MVHEALLQVPVLRHCESTVAACEQAEVDQHNTLVAYSAEAFGCDHQTASDVHVHS